MNKEDILAMAQKENKGKDIEYLEAESKAGSLAAIIAAIFGAIMMFAEMFLRDTYNFSLWAVITVMNTALNLYMFIKLKRKKHLFGAIVWSLWTIGLTIAAISSFINAN